MILRSVASLQATFLYDHFDADFNFCAIEEDPVTKKVPTNQSNKPPYPSSPNPPTPPNQSNPSTPPNFRSAVLNPSCWGGGGDVWEQAITRILSNVKPRDMGALLGGPSSADDDSRLVAAFRDLLDKMFVLDPEKRITVAQAMNHPFINPNK